MNAWSSATLTTVDRIRYRSPCARTRDGANGGRAHGRPPREQAATTAPHPSETARRRRRRASRVSDASRRRLSSMHRSSRTSSAAGGSRAIERRRARVPCAAGLAGPSWCSALLRTAATNASAAHWLLQGRHQAAHCTNCSALLQEMPAARTPGMYVLRNKTLTLWHQCVLRRLCVDRKAVAALVSYRPLAHATSSVSSSDIVTWLRY